MKTIAAWFVLLVSIFCTLFNVSAYAEGHDSPVGLWLTHDLSGAARSNLRISLSGGQLHGTIIKVISGPEVCASCKGQFANKRLAGLTIVWGLKQDGNQWSGGTVLDTDSGKTYRCLISLSDNGQTLHFRGYVGVPMLGKTVDWQRIQ